MDGEHADDKTTATGDVGGDPACWAALLCPNCGAIADSPRAPTCPRCGEPYPLDD